MSEVLDLSGADMTGFELLPSNTYDATVYAIEDVEVQADGGSLPQGTPGFKFQYRIDGGEYDGRYVWSNYWRAPDGHDKKSVMDGIFAKTLQALGYGEKELTSGKFKFDREDVVSRECAVVVGQKDGYNNVKNVKSRVQGGSDDLL